MVVDGTDSTHVPLNPATYLDSPTEFIVHPMGKIQSYSHHLHAFRNLIFELRTSDGIFEDYLKVTVLFTSLAISPQKLKYSLIHITCNMRFLY